MVDVLTHNVTNNATIHGRLSLVDLAGSERISKTGVCIARFVCFVMSDGSRTGWDETQARLGRC
jgi:hypothetical protein